VLFRSYEVWRNTANNSTTASRIPQSVASTSYDDTGAVAGTTYYYWVKAVNAAGTSSFSSPDSGYAYKGIPPISSVVPSILKQPPPPIITRLDPSFGAPGITVAVLGSQLSPSGAYLNPRVVFNTRPAISPQRARVISDKELSVTVPPGNGTVDVYVETVGGKSSILKFAYRSPAITAISPGFGGRGQTVTITGENFGVQGFDAHTFVKFDDSLVAKPLQWDDRRIVVKAPTDFGTGTNWNIVMDLIGCLALQGADSEAAKFVLKMTVPGCSDLIKNVVKKYQLTTNPGFLERRVQVIVQTAAGTSNPMAFTYRVQTENSKSP